MVISAELRPELCRYLCRIKFFKLSEGADVDTFVVKTGDAMTGRLSMDKTADLEDFTVPSLRTDPSIRFLATKSDNSTSTYSLLYQPGYKVGLVCTSGFWASTLITKTYLYGYEDKTESDGRKTRDFKKAGVAFLRPDTNDTDQDYGSLAWNSTNPRLIWNTNRVEIPKPVADDINADGFIIKGAISSDGYSGTNTNVQHDETLLKVYHNNNQSDAINYYGRIVNPKNIATKEYVDSRSSGGHTLNYNQYPIAQYNDYSPYDWRTYTVPPGKMMGAASGSFGITTQKSVMFRDLWTIFPEDEWEFIPGYITFFQYQEHDNFPWYIVWAFRVGSMHRFDEFAQVFQLHWNNDSTPSLNSSKTYKATFECFRRK